MEAAFRVSDATLNRYSGTEARVVVPPGIATIGLRAFAGNKAVREVILPSTVTTIEFAAFSGCANLDYVLVPSSVVSVGCGAFGACPRLRLRYEGRWQQIGFEPDPDVVFIAPAIRFEQNDERYVLQVSMAAGKVVLAAAGEIPDVGEECRRYIRSHSKRVARILRYDVTCMQWLVSSGVFLKRQLIDLSTECTNTGHTEVAAIFLEAGGTDSHVPTLLL